MYRGGGFFFWNRTLSTEILTTDDVPVMEGGKW